MQPDLSPVVGWETGRNSEPNFMDMNLQSTRGCSKPSVCVLQWDLTDPLNPAGLLVSYAETNVLPVVSDFDTFTVGSSGSFEYTDPMPDSQVALIRWSLKHCEAILAKQATNGQGSTCWTKEWLNIMTYEASLGFKPKIPELGFGDAASLELIRDIVHHTSACGAIRHGAECFNSYFPQELDEEFLVVWEGFEQKHGARWLNHSESELRAFLLERIRDGYVFPINPVWAVRDEGWYEVFVALRNSPSANEVLPIWYPGDLIELVERLHADYPDCLVRKEMKAAANADFVGDEALNYGVHAAEKVSAHWKKVQHCVSVKNDLVKRKLARSRSGDVEEGSTSGMQSLS